jgi:hypothetical protein
MKRIVKLTESDLTRIVKRVIIEQNEIMLSEQWGQIAKKALGMAAKSEDEIATLLKTTETTLLKSMDEIVGTALKSKSISQIDDIQKKLMHFYNPSGLPNNVASAQQKMKNFLNGYSKSKGRTSWKSFRDEASGVQNVSQKSSQAGAQAVNNMMKGQRVSNRWYGWKPENIDFTKFSNKMSFDDLNKSIATAIKTKNWNLVPRAGFEKFGIPNMREYLQNNISKINDLDPTTGRWSVIFK